MNAIHPADVPNSTPRVRRLRARRSAPSGLRGRLTGDTPAGAVRLAVVETLAGDLGLDLGAAVRLALAIPDTETAVASAVPRYAILADDRSIFATDPAALLRGGIPAAAVIIDLSAIVSAVLGNIMNTFQHFAMLPVAPKREIHAALVEHLTAKARGRPPKGEARQYANLRLSDIARLAAGDHARQMDMTALLDQTFSGSHGTSDFPLILQDAANKVLLETLEAAPPSYRAWAQRRQFRDFKAHKFLRVGDFPAFTQVPEPASMKLGTVDESRETVTLVSYTSGISFTREALINDDLGALSLVGNSIATRASATEAELAYGVLAANPVMADGIALFHADHGNLASSGAALDVTSLAAGRKAMREQVHGDMLLNLPPRFLVVGPAYETAADKVLAEITPTSAANVNPFSGKLELVVDANITGNAWYLFADPAAWPSIVFGHLHNLEGPEVWVVRNPNTRALDIHAGLDFAVGAIDFRGVYCNPGAA